MSGLLPTRRNDVASNHLVMAPEAQRFTLYAQITQSPLGVFAKRVEAHEQLFSIAAKLGSMLVLRARDIGERIQVVTERRQFEQRGFHFASRAAQRVSNLLGDLPLECGKRPATRKPSIDLRVIWNVLVCALDSTQQLSHARRHGRRFYTPTDSENTAHTRRAQKEALRARPRVPSRNDDDADPQRDARADPVRVHAHKNRVGRVPVG